MPRWGSARPAQEVRPATVVTSSQGSERRARHATFRRGRHRTDEQAEDFSRGFDALGELAGILAVGNHHGIGAETDWQSRRQRPPEAGVLDGTDGPGTLSLAFGDRAVAPFDGRGRIERWHVEGLPVGGPEHGHCLVIQIGAVIHGTDAGADGRLDPLGPMRMRRDRPSPSPGLGDGRLKILKGMTTPDEIAKFAQIEGFDPATEMSV